MSSASIAQEYYKLQEDWKKIDKNKSWKMAVWVAEYQDIDIIDKFLEIERSPIGIFDDIFFKFDTIYTRDVIQYERLLWSEFVSWFQDTTKPEMNLNNALFENGILSEKFKPNENLEPTSQNLWNELARLRSLLKNIDNNTHFCIYIPIPAYLKENMSDWFTYTIKFLPKELRLVTIDYAKDRKLNLPSNLPCTYIYPKLEMAAAIKNEMAKDGGNFDTVDPFARFRQQVIKLMESTTKNVKNNTPIEVNKLFEITKEINTLPTKISGLLVAAQAYYAINHVKESEKYTDQAIELAQEAMNNNDPTGYPVWKSCMMLKAALLYGRKERKEAIIYYENLADVASKNADPFIIMEGRRLVGHIQYELGKHENALQNMLLAMAAGSYLSIEIRRQSTFLHVCYMAIYLAGITRTKNDIDIIKLQIKEWLGTDWEELLQQAGLETAKTKMKKSIF